MNYFNFSFNLWFIAVPVFPSSPYYFYYSYMSLTGIFIVCSQVINPTNGDPTPELELYPISLRLFRHSPPPTRGGITTWTGVGFGLSSFGFGTNSLATPHAPPKRYLAYVASFSRMNTIQQVRK